MQSKVLTEMITKSSAGLAQATADLGDKATWKPLDKGRSAVDQCVECGFVSNLIAGALNTQGLPAFDRDGILAAKADNDTPEKALALLTSGTEALIAAIAAFPADQWDTVQALPQWGDHSFTELVMYINWNNIYHEGQISYISTLL